MKIDDKRLEEARKSFEERLNRQNELMVSVVRHHIGLEQMMDGFLAAALPHPDRVLSVQRFGYSHKIHLCRALFSDDNDDPVWNILWGFDSVRNEVAHGLDDEKLKAKMISLRRTYVSALNEDQRDAARKLTDNQLVPLAAGLVAGVLVNAEDKAKERREADRKRGAVKATTA